MNDRDVILVVDDEDAVRETIASSLRRAGYEVVVASSGHEALQVLDSRSDITVLLTDCNMPILSGADLARTVMRLWPRVKVVAMSGQPRSDEIPREVTFLAKPFPTSAIVDLMKAAHAARAEAALTHAFAQASAANAVTHPHPELPSAKGGALPLRPR